jgi:hypothetical protein
MLLMPAYSWRMIADDADDADDWYNSVDCVDLRSAVAKARETKPQKPF